MLTFSNRTALITGAGRGIGKAIAETLAKQGVTVICVSKSADSCGATAAAINASGGKAKALAVDVADGAAIAKASEELLKEFPAIDILVNNAGITRDGLLFRMSETDWNDVIGTNLTSCFHWTKLIGRPMTRARWGRIVNIASVAGMWGAAGGAAYAASKAGLIKASESWARELGPLNISVTAVAPGICKTNMLNKFVDEEAQMSADEAKLVKSIVPVGRWGTADDVAEVVTFLATCKTNYLNAAVIPMDGGMRVGTL